MSQNSTGSHQKLPRLSSLWVSALLWSLVLCFAALLLQAWISYQNYDTRVSRLVQQALITAALPARISVEYLDSSLAQSLVDGMVTSGTFQSIQLYNDFGELMASAHIEPTPLRGLPYLLSAFGIPPEVLMNHAVDIPKGGAARLQVVVSMRSELISFVDELLISLAAAILFCMSVGALVYWRTSRALQIGLQRLLNWARRNTPLQEAEPLPSAKLRFSELALLGEQLNETMSGLRAQFEENERQRIELEYSALIDPLTGLANRRRLAQICSENQYRCGNGGLIFCDVDNFKRLNDRFGYRIGDQVLQHVGIVLKQVSQKLPNDIIVDLVRYGGDEFLIVLRESGEHSVDTQCIHTLCHQLCACFVRPLNFDGTDVHCSLTLGYAVVEFGKEPLELQIEDVSHAMMEEKKRGKAGIGNLATSLSGSLKRVRSIYRGIESALVEKQFVMYYRPRFNFEMDACGLSAALHWRHPVYGLLSPGNFMHAADTGPLANEAVTLALARLESEKAPLQELALISTTKTLTYPLSGAQLLSDALLPAAGKLMSLQDNQFQLCFEITEDPFRLDEKLTIRRLKKLQELGVLLALNTSAVGAASSLKVLLGWQWWQIRIDLEEAQSNEDFSDTLIQIPKLVELCRDNEMSILCGGIQSQSQLQLALDVGCNELEGDFLACMANIENLYIPPASEGHSEQFNI